MAGEPMMNPDPGASRYDVPSDSQGRVAELPAAFLPLSAAFAGERLAIVGWTTGGKIGPSRNTEVYVVDLRGGTVLKRELGGVRAGQVQDLAAFDDVRNVMPAVAWDLPRGRAFVVDAEQIAWRSSISPPPRCVDRRRFDHGGRSSIASSTRSPRRPPRRPRRSPSA